MKSKYPHLNWQIEDVRHLSLEDGTFDFAVDKVFATPQPRLAHVTMTDCFRERWTP